MKEAWTPTNVPAVLVGIVDVAAGKTHSDTGAVRTALADVLNAYDRIKGGTTAIGELAKVADWLDNDHTKTAYEAIRIAEHLRHVIAGYKSLMEDCYNCDQRVAGLKECIADLNNELAKREDELLSRLTAPTRDEVQTAIHDAYVRDVKPPSFLTVKTMWQLTDAVLALLPRAAAGPPERIKGEFVKRDGTVVDGWPNGNPIGRYTTEGVVYDRGVAAEQNDKDGS